MDMTDQMHLVGRENISSIIRRNDHLLGTGKYIDHALASSAEQILIRHLDGFENSSYLSETVAACARTNIAYSRSVDIILRWACSTLRYGAYRVYLAACLLVGMRMPSDDMDGILFEFFDGFHNDSSVITHHVTRLYTTLIRRGQSDVNRYLRWIVATGALYDAKSREVVLSMMSEHDKVAILMHTSVLLFSYRLDKSHSGTHSRQQWSELAKKSAGP